MKEKREKNNSYANSMWRIINSRKNQLFKERENGCVIKGLSSIEKLKMLLEIPRPLHFLKNKLFCVLLRECIYFHCSQHFTLQQKLAFYGLRPQVLLLILNLSESGIDVATLVKTPRKSYHLYLWSLHSPKADVSSIGTNSNHPSLQLNLTWYSRLLIGHCSSNWDKVTMYIS